MTARHLQVRDATPGDAPAIARLLGELGYPSEASEIPGRLSRVRAHGGTVVLAVDDDDNPLGLISLTIHWGLHSSGSTAYIMALVIAEAARGTGVGKRLVEYARQWGTENGCDHITVTSAEHRDGAHAFYPAVGLPYTGRRFSVAIASDNA
ncbi:MAG TPA: GNAT family N-acetyltransferase [Gemmatimonadaceae bacterium]|nr:GNAT family N-acetyltransferase [Gemmatimonadaceae bacterium]